MDNKEFLINALEKYNLPEEKINALYEYCLLLMQENEKYDLTAIKTFEDIVYFHVIDSLHASTLDEFKNANTITDIGTGAGAPGLILALVYDDKHFNLVEILHKRIHFLEKSILLFSLKNCTIIPFDFKTVIRRKLVDQKSIFISRATLSFDKLLYIFNGESMYKQSLLVYWGSKIWNHDLPFIKTTIVIKQYPYLIKDKERVYVVAQEINK